MFTGIVEEMGTVRSLEIRSDSAKLKVAAAKVLTDVRLGDSIAVNGVCLTVVSFVADSFIADVMPETLRKTNLGQLRPGDRVNLERAMALGGRLGGHLVSGHVDGTGRIRDKRGEGNAVVITLEAPPEIMRFIVPKGSIAIDGISLTVANAGTETFSVSVIPHTLTQTTLGTKSAGDLVNLENDMIGKYVDRLIHAYQGNRTKEMDMDFLKVNGFIQ